MELKPGDKQTEIGVIPSDWDMDLVDNIAYITTGDKNTQDRIADGEYPFFVRSQKVEKINSYSFDGEAVLTAGDGVGTGKVFHYINGKFDAHQRVYCISNFSERINGYYFYLYFSSHFYKRIMQMTAKSSVDSVRREMIANMLIPLPPNKAEQEAIAEALSDTDALIESLEQLIAKKRQIKQGTMQELLIGKKRLSGFQTKPGYKQTEVGLIPEDWKVKNLGSFCKITAGGDLDKEDFSLMSDDRFRFPIYSNAVTYKGLYGYAKSHQYDSDKITITARGDIGHAFYRDKKFCAIGRLLVLSSLIPCDLRFITEFINNFVDFAYESTGVPQLTAPQLAKYSIALPPAKNEQAAI
ncbi:MAG: restriction endonuclease subunit S, partial [Deltaproteobacteria bacterium]|nr:restriction endonuclease subunit S [Deltaproteobacteria bacterium]